MRAMRAVALLRIAACAAGCVLIASACDGPPHSDAEQVDLSSAALRTDSDSGAQSGSTEAEHALFVTGSFDTRLELGGQRLVMDVCNNDVDPSCVPSKGRQQLFVASLDARGQARWLLAPLQSAHESRLYDTQVLADSVVMLAAYRGAPALHPRLSVPPAQDMALVLLEVDRQGTLVRARKLADSPGYLEAKLVAEPSGEARVSVAFQGRLQLSGRSVLAGRQGSRVSLDVAPDFSSFTLGPVADMAPASACGNANVVLCKVGPALTPNCSKGICSKDPFCCNNAWDLLCVTEASERVVDCNCTHAFEATGLRLPRGCDSPSDIDYDCPSQVCDGSVKDPYCCDTYWDSLCVDHAVDLPECND